MSCSGKRKEEEDINKSSFCCFLIYGASLYQISSSSSSPQILLCCRKLAKSCTRNLHLINCKAQLRLYKHAMEKAQVLKMSLTPRRHEASTGVSARAASSIQILLAPSYPACPLAPQEHASSTARHLSFPSQRGASTLSTTRLHSIL